jgi:hypothetical protein
MSADPFRHSLVHVFLQEELGDKKPPDLSQEILAKAFDDEKPGLVSRRSSGPSLRLRGRRRWPAVAAAAAAILIGLTVWLLMPGGYPGLTISGDYEIASGDELQRGVTIRTEEGSAVLALGGYCQVDIKPWTTLRIDGADYGEELFVEVGMVVCSVDSKVGRFGVLSELGSARVTGTKFTVRVEEFGGLRQMRVTVAEGAVEVSDGSVSGVLPAGKERTIVGSEPRQPETAPVTKPKDNENTDIVIEPIDPGGNSEFTSSSDDGLPELRLKILAAQERVEQVENEIRKLREENRLMQKDLDELVEPAENPEHEQTERQSPNHE